MPHNLYAAAAVVVLASCSLNAQETDYNKAIAYGQSFKSRLQFLEKV